ncbi:MAG: selenium cofactor biosynthesis protein YqeC [Halobacteriales archaeon]|nr:selenium cofactor biosynthesis protein YqeC [Halobacteriales archaeon]
MELVEALEAREGLTCVVGAGGKKSTLYALAGAIDRAVVTATVRIPIFDERVASVTATDDPVGAVRAAAGWPVGVVAERNGDRYEGYEPAVVDRLADAGVADAVLVKADGARTRWLKAPGEHEPRIPAGADVVVPIASARVVGEPLDEARVHRPERVADVAGLALGDRLRPEDVAAVLASDEGGLADVPEGATAIPLLNMVDDAALEATAREIADELLARADVPRVVLTRLLDEEPVVGVVER